MALADFGVKAVLPDQVIVDMLIEHRRIHRHRPKLREDYYRRTLAKAHEHMDKTTCVNQSASQPPPVGASGEPGPADETLRKALLCERLSTLLGNVITILRILKVAGSDPTYHLELDGCTVILGNVNQLIDQGRLRTRVAEQTEKMIPRLTRREGDPVARMLLEAVTICPGGAEADYKGRARMLLEDYLQDFDCTADPQNRPRDLRKKPVVFEGRLSIHSVDFRQHIFHTNGETVGPKVCASMHRPSGRPFLHWCERCAAGSPRCEWKGGLQTPQASCASLWAGSEDQPCSQSLGGNPPRASAHGPCNLPQPRLDRWLPLREACVQPGPPRGA